VNWPVKLAVAVETDLRAAFDWYEYQSPGLGESFLSEVEYTLSRIGQFPESYQVNFSHFRCAPLRRFPYGVFYRVWPHLVEVDAILGCRIHPRRIKARLDQ
jgi:plasmid stabilization system protein ParE